MFRGKESINRIELSQLVQDLLNFGVLGSLRLWGWGAGWMGVVWGPPHTCTHTRTHTRMCMHGKHYNSMQMATPIGFGEIPGIPYDVIHAYMCVHAYVHVCGGTLSPPPPPSTHPPSLRGDPRNQSKFNST